MCALRKLPGCTWGGLCSSLSQISQIQSRSHATGSGIFDLPGCRRVQFQVQGRVRGGDANSRSELISRIRGDGAKCRSWSLRSSCFAESSRLQVVGARGFGGRPAAAGAASSSMEGEGGLQEAKSSSAEEEDEFRGGRFCILLTGHASDYTQRLYGGYSQMFIKLLGDPRDMWDVFPVVEGVFPAEEDLGKYDGFVVTGSRHDAHGDDEWIVKLCALLQTLHERRTKMLGVCFGHQVLSRALGGRTGKAEVGWEVGVRNVQLTDAMFAKPYAAGAPPVIRIYESHRDQVKEIPPGGELLGFSERTGIEMYAVGDNILAIQGHPEFSEDVVRDIVDTRSSSGVLNDAETKTARDTLKEGPHDREILQRICKLFLKEDARTYSIGIEMYDILTDSLVQGISEDGW
ncbi:hypothetical protein AXG93_1660s1370 [Marchantia polymorpha subsp. ruderalis]|uniref:Glutamine amidotransferase domain-containing protein n=1 Tax=Marchantia polymorpha subsp. ruderalis TaxID=1480154 RepID=A0A176VR61_MARPO|nr:hypothetical protein AXG93_1660s1370 [Marchantia polymorpha subsp. ruderalis]